MNRAYLLFSLPLLLLLLLAGCDPEAENDTDNDGYPAPADCNDLDTSVHPGAGELCDGVDNDCDGAIDEGYDEDADGFKPCGDEPDCDDEDLTSYPGAEEVCDFADNNCDGVVDEGCDVDADGDGWNFPEDCDDTDPTIYPGAEEVCDGVDNNCEEGVDEGFDADGDGWSACGDTPDCDDDDEGVNPGVDEACDGQDNDCDGVVDEGFDLDGDGWTTCDSPPDCDDGDGAINPGAPELCNGEDEDCDGEIDEDTTDDADGDGVSACNGDCDDGDPDIFPGGIELPNGLDDDCNGVVDDGYSGTLGAELFDPKATGSVTQGRLGDTLSAAGFFDPGDLSDFLSGSSVHDNGRGRASLFLGTSYSLGAPPADFAPFATVTGALEGDALGHSVDLGDINGDGFDDMIIGAPELGSSSPPKGNVHIFFGGPVATSGDWPVEAADVTITGGFPTEQCGTAVASLGDVDGDLVDDLAFSCPWYNPGGGLRGRTVIFFGRSSWDSTYTSDDADASFVGGDEDVYSGQALEGLDLDGDDLNDLVIGSPDWNSGTGRIAVALGSGASGWSSGMSMDSMNRLYPANNSSHALGGWLGSGDANGDSYDDLLVGAPGFGADKGILALLLGAASPPSSGSFWGLTQMYVTGDVTSEAAGSTGSLVDLDGDGAIDLVVATPGYDGGSGGDQGRLTLFLGPLDSYSGTYAASDGTVTLVGEDGGDYFGGASCLLPDFNGDGGPDLAVSSPYNDEGAANGGRVYLIPSF